MRLGLMESQRKRERHARGMVASVVLHAVVIGLAWHATAGAHVVRTTVDIVRPLPLPPPPVPPTRPRHGGGASGGGGPSGPILPPTTPIDVGPLPVPAPPAVWDSLVGAPTDWGAGHHSGAQPGQPGPDGDGVFRTVDVMAEPRSGNPAPVYPSILRDAGIEGTVSARFVVDSTGRVEPESIAFVDTASALFQQSVRRALASARFSPAKVNGRAVRVLMAQTFTFRLRR